MAPLYLCLIRALGNYNYPFYVIAVFPCFDLGYVLIAILCFHMYSLKLNFTLFTPNYSNQVKNKLNTICNYNIKNKHWFCNLPIFQVGSISWPTWWKWCLLELTMDKVNFRHTLKFNYELSFIAQNEGLGKLVRWCWLLYSFIASFI